MLRTGAETPFCLFPPRAHILIQTFYHFGAVPHTWSGGHAGEVHDTAAGSICFPPVSGCRAVSVGVWWGSLAFAI
jgi:hypothetical protein